MTADRTLDEAMGMDLAAELRARIDRLSGHREVRRVDVTCCPCHGRACSDEPCCPLCAEHAHDFEGFTTGTHRDGTPCASPDLSQPTGTLLDRAAARTGLDFGDPR